jgi:hypothetical protein
MKNNGNREWFGYTSYKVWHHFCVQRLSILPLFVVILTFSTVISVEGDTPSFPGIPADYTLDVKTVDPLRGLIGAKGDSIHDDTVAIQDAINFVSSHGGGTVFFPEGIYLVNDIGNNQGYYYEILLKSHIRLLGEGGRTSILKMPAGSRTDPADRAGRRNKAMVVIGDRTYDSAHRDRWQEDIEIAYLGFDLDNGIGRRALQLRNPARNVRIHHCEGFQSDLETGAAPCDELRSDNHFFNMAVNGFPIDNGGTPDWVDISQNITVDHCVVRGLMQLTSNGDCGIRNLWIHHNSVYDAMSYAIAVTSLGPVNTILEGILIEDNTIESPRGAGILVGMDYVGPNADLSSIEVNAFRNVTIRRNTIHIRSIPSGNFVWSGKWSPNGDGIIVGSGLMDTRNYRIEDNVITAENFPAISTSREGVKIAAKNFGWSETFKHNHGGKEPIISAAEFNAADSTITMEEHGLASGLLVQFKPLSALPLPTGLDPYWHYRVLRISADRFSLVELTTGSPVAFSAAPSGGSYELFVTARIEDMVVTRNRVEGNWDWGVVVADGTKNLSFYDNELVSRLFIGGTHDNFYFVNNRSEGVMEITNSTLRHAAFDDNSWSIDESQFGYQWAPGVISICGAPDLPATPLAPEIWRSVEASFENNTFSFVPASHDQQRIFAAIWMNHTDWFRTENGCNWTAWPGSAFVEIYSNRFLTPEKLEWRMESEFVTGWRDNTVANGLASDVIPPQ